MPSSVAACTFTVSEDMTLEAHFIPSSFTAPAIYGYGAVTDDSTTPYTISGGAGGTVEVSFIAVVSMSLVSAGSGLSV